MLVLSRYAGEQIQIGDDIVITVTEIMENRVRLGFTAPRGTVILRRELVGSQAGDNLTERAEHAGNN